MKPSRNAYTDGTSPRSQHLEAKDMGHRKTKRARPAQIEKARKRREAREARKAGG